MIKNTLPGITGLWMQELDAGLWTLDAGLWILNSGRWTLDAGRWTLEVLNSSHVNNDRAEKPIFHQKA